MRLLHLALATLIVLLAPYTASRAQTAPPAGLTQEQMDAMVSAITKSVLEQLKAQPPVAPAATPPAADGPDAVDQLVQNARTRVGAIPDFGRGLVRLAEQLDAGGHGGRGAGVFLLLLLGSIVAALGAEALVRTSLGSVRERMADKARPERGAPSLAYLGGLALLDGLCVFALWLVGRGALAVLFTTSTFQDRFAFAALATVFAWRLYSLLFRVILRPGLPAARLCAVTDAEAHHAYRTISTVVLVLALFRLTALGQVAADTPMLAVEAGRLVFSPILMGVFVVFVLSMREPARQWFGGLGTVAPFARVVGQYWVPLALSFFLALVLTLAYGAVSGRNGIGDAMLVTLNLVFGLLLFETFLQAIVQRFDSRLPGFTPAGEREKLPDVVARCLRVAVLIGVIVVVSEHWIVDVLGIVNATAWDKLTRSARAAGLTLFTAFVLWELVKFFSEAYMQRLSEKALEGASAASTSGTRLGTLMPLVRVTLAVLIGAVAVLIALSDIGVDITPLLAGLSVFGLAVSFGSQTLVKDIVSGIFYLADDAFRVGEQIDCGKAVGVVEGFTLRSIRLRQSNGQLHTIPFGELGQIANFSRDWAAATFTLRFARDTDLEKLRAATKALGADLADDPKLGADILEPLKMQGIGEVGDNALVVRFKFKARPGNPGRIQDEAIHRILRTFPAQGLALV